MRGCTAALNKHRVQAMSLSKLNASHSFHVICIGFLSGCRPVRERSSATAAAVVSPICQTQPCVHCHRYPSAPSRESEAAPCSSCRSPPTRCWCLSAALNRQRRSHPPPPRSAHPTLRYPAASTPAHDRPRKSGLPSLLAPLSGAPQPHTKLLSPRFSPPAAASSDSSAAFSSAATCLMIRAVRLIRAMSSEVCSDSGGKRTYSRSVTT